MNTNIKTILASTLLTALFAATSANAEGRAGGNIDYEVENKSVEIQKVSLPPATVDASYEVDTNR